MKWFRLRPGKRWLTALLGAVVLVPAAWVALLAVVPTDCARRKIAERISQASGRNVRLGRVHVGLLGGVSLGDLEIGAPGPGDNPWLKVGTASIDVNLLQMMLGRVEPTRVEVRDVRLRVLRRADGSMELADLLRPAPGPTASSSETAEDCEPPSLEVRVRGGSVVVVDEPTGTRLEFTNVEGRGTSKECVSSISELRGTLNGGTVRLAAQVDRSETSPQFEGQVRLRDVTLGDGTAALAYLVPVLAGTRGGCDGRLSLDLYLRGQGDSRVALRQTLVGQGHLGLDSVSLDGSRLLAGLGDLLDKPTTGRFGDVSADVTIKEGRVASENLTVRVASVPVVFAGWTDFDGRVNYRFHPGGLVDKLPPEARELLNRHMPELRLDELAEIKIEGTVDALSVTSRGVPVTRRRHDEIGRRASDPLRR